MIERIDVHVFHDPELERLARIADAHAARMQTAGSPTAQAAGQMNPGEYFDVPGIPGGSTQWTDQDDTIAGIVTTLSATAQVPVTGMVPLKQTDVVADWLLELNFVLAWTAGTGQTITASAYAPMNIVGPNRLLIQNQYASVDVESGIDLYIFDTIRPQYKNASLNGILNYTNPNGNPIGGTATGYPTAALAQANQIWGAAQFSTASTSLNLLLRQPAAQWFDEYFDLAADGTPVTQPHPALVSPQYMASPNRIITPTILYNPGYGATSDLAPVTTTALTPTSDTASTFTGTATLTVRRHAIYASQPAVLPPVYAWQYRRKTQRFGLGGVSRSDLLMPLDVGQLLMTYVRMFDPLAAAGVGAPINVNVVTRANLQYGSGLFWFDTGSTQPTGRTAYANLQARYLEQHGNLPPQGVLVFDLAIDERGRVSNKRALNTLTTGGIDMHLEFSSALSASAYAVLGTESLVYVV